MVQLLTAFSALLLGVLGGDIQAGSDSGKALVKAAKGQSVAVSFFAGSAPDPQATRVESVALVVGAPAYERVVLVDGAHLSYPGLRGANTHAAQRSGYPPSLA